MANKTEVCDNCKQTFLVRVLRYVRDPNKPSGWAYLCNECRKARGLPNATGH